MLVQCEIAGDGFFDTCRVKTGGQHGTGTDTGASLGVERQNYRLVGFFIV